MVVLAGALLAARLLPEGESRPVAWGDLSAEVGPLRIERFERRLFREQDALARYLKLAESDASPAVDFSARQLLLVSPGPRSSTGYAVEVLAVSERGGTITVRVRERTPTVGDRVDPGVTYPYRLISLPAGRDVYVDWAGR